MICVLSYAFNLGSHSLKVGYEYLAVNTAIQDTNPLLGLDTYSGQYTRPIAIPATDTTPAVPAPPASNLYNISDFFFGLRSQYELANLTVAQMRQRFHFGYIQDDFKVNRKLTLNLGLRYEFGTPYYEKNNKLSNYDPVSNSIILAKSGSLTDRGLVKPDYNNFGPRLGFAYNILDKTVIRGGYGVGYVFLNRLGSANILGTNFPFITRAAVAQVAPSPTNNPLVRRRGLCRKLFPHDASRLSDERFAEQRHALYSARFADFEHSKLAGFDSARNSF